MRCIFLLISFLLQPSTNVAVAGNNKEEKIPLNLAVFYENKQNRYDYRCIRSASEIALSYINNDTNILPDHQLKFDVYHHVQSAPQKVATGSTVRSWFKMLDQNITTQGIIGPSNSDAMLGLHEMNIDHWIPMIGYAAIRESPFPKQFDIRVNPTRDFFIEALISFVTTMGWKRFGILYSLGSLAFKTENIPLRDELTARLKDINAEKVIVEKFSLDRGKHFENQFQVFKENDIRIIFLLTHTGGYFKLFCEAYKHGMYTKDAKTDNDKDYVYLALHSLPRFRRFSVSEYNCTENDVVEAADGTFTFLNLHDRLNKDVVVITGKTTRDIQEEIMSQKIKKTTDRFCHENIYNSAFDAIYNMALGFHSMLYKGGKKIRDYVVETYGDKKTLQMAAESFTKVSFEGLTGHVKYNSENQRLAEIMIMQFTKERRAMKKLAYHDGDKLHYLQHEEKGKYGLFKDGIIPLDGYIKEYVSQTHKAEMKYAIWTIAGAFIFMSLLLLFINITYRQRSLIKMSSPNINNIILIGSILCYVTIIIHGMDGHCNEEVIILTVGFTLLFGGLFCKTWRVYRIFTAVELLRTIAIKDTQLYLMIFFLAMVDAIVCTIWMLLSPYEVQITEKLLPPQNQTQIVELYSHCVSEHQTKFEVTVFIYKGLLMVFGLFLAFETRKVEIPALNDSKLIGSSIYTVVVVGILGTISCYALDDDEYNIRYIIFTLSIVVSTVASILFIFLPKLILLFGKDPDGSREKQQIRSRYFLDDSVNTQSTTDSRSRTVSRKETIDNGGNLSIVYENQADNGSDTQTASENKQI